MVIETINNFIDRISDSAFDLISAGVIFLFGGYFAYVIGKKTGELLKRTKLNQIIVKRGGDDFIACVWRGGSVAQIFGKAAEVLVVLFFLMICAGILQLAAMSDFLNMAVMYFFNIFAVVLIIAVVAELFLNFGGKDIVAKTLNKIKNRLK